MRAYVYVYAALSTQMVIQYIRAFHQRPVQEESDGGWQGGKPPLEII